MPLRTNLSKIYFIRRTGSISFAEMYKNKTQIKKKPVDTLHSKDEKENKSSIQKAI